VTLHQSLDEDAFWTSPLVEWSKDRVQDRLQWADIDLDRSDVHLGIRCLVVKVWFVVFVSPSLHNDGATEHRGHSPSSPHSPTQRRHVPSPSSPHNDSCSQADSAPSSPHDAPPEKCFLEASWGVHLSGLQCLGPHPPAHGRLPSDSIVFYMSGSYFSAPPSIKQSSASRHLFIKAKSPEVFYLEAEEDGNQGQNKANVIMRPLPTSALATKSYDTGLVLRLHRMQRALHQIESRNERLKSQLAAKGVLEEAEIKARMKEPQPQPQQQSLREAVMQQINSMGSSDGARKARTARSRIAETHLRLQMESLAVRLSMLKNEVGLQGRELVKAKDDSDSTLVSNGRRKDQLMQRLTSVSRQKNAHLSWAADHRKQAIQAGIRSRAVKEIRLNLVRNLSLLYPVGNLGSSVANVGHATLRWVSLPDAGQALREFTPKNEVGVSVAVCWLGHLIHHTACLLDVPLRYPIRLMGSHSFVADPFAEKFPFKGAVSGVGGGSSCVEEYPLFVKGNNDLAKFECGVYLLAKNIAQLRWLFSLTTKDPKAMLENVAEVMQMGKSDEHIDRILRMLPPAAPILMPPPQPASDVIFFPEKSKSTPNKLVNKLNDDTSDLSLVGGGESAHNANNENSDSSLVGRNNCAIPNGVETVGKIPWNSKERDSKEAVGRILSKEESLEVGIEVTETTEISYSNEPSSLLPLATTLGQSCDVPVTSLASDVPVTSSSDVPVHSEPSSLMPLSTEDCDAKDQTPAAAAVAKTAGNDVICVVGDDDVTNIKTEDDFWSSATSQSIALLSNPANFQQGRTISSSSSSRTTPMTTPKTFHYK